jgi:small subunit ribosomal protein S16
MLTIRFIRAGKKHQPSFKIVAVEKSRSASSGKFLEELGSYNPLQKKTNLNKERILHWISKGAGISDTARNLFIKFGVIKGKKIAKNKPSKKVEEAPKTPSTVAPVVETPKEEIKVEQPAVDTQNSGE